ncbi:MAG: tRNA epoxyqueuosine(34) reductase QueG [Acidimicrobiia bacterium]|nr:tRNA epoxyqueuosine(34) reductase QueG [Acidimicrobiia bacterium]MYC58214.1 tRNA epoxyqueuosine(34) reductase QueG [Acidimicrobiia bacterium]MYI30315.1 tRNA epoxyqueuosine(34) reductase QueG [Acidimicrobiia bacterium]
MVNSHGSHTASVQQLVAQGLLSAREVIDAGLDAGLDAVGIASAAPFESTKVNLLERQAKGLHGGMAFTYRNPARSTDPAYTVPGARSLVVGALSYRPSSDTGCTTPDVSHIVSNRPLARVAAYAQRDYYAKLRSGLSHVADLLHQAGHKAVVVADDNALVDREAARRAGLGWYGKNSNILLSGKGSWFVLGSVITTAPLESARPVSDGCGSCRRCMDGCPTGAIVSPGVVDARRCLAWLVQAEGDFPEQYRVALGDRIYGCDDCQEVCPPNRRATTAATVTTASETQASVDLLELLAMNDEELMDSYGRWYIPRRQPRYLRRNALVALGNSNRGSHPEVAATIWRYMNHDDPMLGRHATWAAQQLGLANQPCNIPTEVA